MARGTLGEIIRYPTSSQPSPAHCQPIFLRYRNIRNYSKTSKTPKNRFVRKIAGTREREPPSEHDAGTVRRTAIHRDASLFAFYRTKPLVSFEAPVILSKTNSSVSERKPAHSPKTNEKRTHASFPMGRATESLVLMRKHLWQIRFPNYKPSQPP